MAVKKYAFIALTAAAIFVGRSAAWAQAPGPGTTPLQGFSVPVLINQLSLYLPAESTQGLFGFGGRGGAGGPGGGQGNSAGGAAGGQASGAGQGATAGQSGQRPQFRQLLQYTRDPKLYLTKGQIAALIPILQGIRENPILTPSKAKQVQASVDAGLSVAQKAEYADYQKQMQKAFEEIRKQFAASGAGTGQGSGGGFGGQDQSGGNAAGQRQASGAGGAASGAQMTPTQRAQRELDAFIKVLQDRQKQIGV